MLTCEPVIQKLLDKGDKVLVVGVHTGGEAKPFIDAGKDVTGVDMLPPYRNSYKHVRSRYETAEFDEPFDVLLCSHVLEHTPDPGTWLRKFAKDLKEDGWLGLVVPGYPQDEFFVGHLTLWTPALLLYNLVCAGWDCSDAEYYTTPDRKHVGVVVQNRRANASLGWDGWDDAQQVLPVEMKHKMNAWIPDRW